MFVAHVRYPIDWRSAGVRNPRELPDWLLGESCGISHTYTSTLIPSVVLVDASHTPLTLANFRAQSPRGLCTATWLGFAIPLACPPCVPERQGEETTFPFPGQKAPPFPRLTAVPPSPSHHLHPWPERVVAHTIGYNLSKLSTTPTTIDSSNNQVLLLTYPLFWPLFGDMTGVWDSSFPFHILFFFFMVSTIFYMEWWNLWKFPELPAPRVELPPSSWTVNTKGRLGNQMGQYATLYALAKLNRKRAVISPKMQKTLGRLFHITLPVLTDTEDLQIPWVSYQLEDRMKHEYRHIPWKYIFFKGFPCSWTFYHHLRDEILREFSLHVKVREEAQAFLHQVRKGRGHSLTFVGVHVRRGDYVHVMPERWEGVVADRGYLEQALDWFRARYTNVVFVVTSDGMAWCRRNIDTSKGDVVFARGWMRKSAEKDFALLTQCNHTVMTIGTFGFWAAYMAGGNTVYLANYTLPNSKFLKIFKPEAAFLPEWVGIPADLSPLLRDQP
ncbi:galactoside alpha-(1,2)-fucosyltransferase 2-like [Trichosurus vulpecula]|uniref:galactoside alpha-(1,2)-fucosyltransferase 2-like n=1 Tax=Trichosurus vulpecula TaxID=9337 RepID=UPI00186B029B|nr:galactoside alpha-(1,2)-fucosyltransferase 2-like [Trichosurus vulpecula]